MKYFDETAAYWGDSFEKIVLAGNNRLTVRSVKIFADGKLVPVSGCARHPIIPCRRFVIMLNLMCSIQALSDPVVRL